MLRSSLMEHEELRHRLEQDSRELELEKTDEVVVVRKKAEIDELEQKVREI